MHGLNDVGWRQLMLTKCIIKELTYPKKELKLGEILGET